MELFQSDPFLEEKKEAELDGNKMLDTITIQREENEI